MQIHSFNGVALSPLSAPQPIQSPTAPVTAQAPALAPAVMRYAEAPMRLLGAEGGSQGVSVLGSPVPVGPDNGLLKGISIFIKPTARWDIPVVAWKVVDASGIPVYRKPA